MKALLTVSAASAVLALCGVRGAAEAEYFESVWRLKDRQTPFCLTVGNVFEDSPAREAGLRPGDRIVGVDGVRVRTPAEYTFMRYYHDSRPVLALTVLRRESLVDVPIEETVPVRRGGFYWRSPYDKYYELLLDWNLKFNGGRQMFTRAGVKEETQEDVVTDLFDSFGVKKPRIVTQAGRLLTRFPARGWETLVALMAGGRADDRRWVEAILNVYLHLRFEEMQQAAKMIAETKLESRAPTPFLKDLVTFYRRVSEGPPGWGAPRIWERYETDLAFFVVCYPYPVRKEKGTTKSFAFDPEFQRMFDEATAGIWVDHGAIGAKAMRYAHAGAGGDPVERYVGQVRAALLDPGEHGGWPYRSPVAMTNEQRTKILAGMAERLKERPEERVLTAFVMLCPAVVNNDSHQFNRVYPILFNAGTRERACANAMIGGALGVWTQRQKYREMIAELEKGDPKPKFYDHMLATSPAFRYKARLGSYYRQNTGIVGLESWAADGLHDVARALVAPLESGTLDRLCDAEAGGDGGVRRKAFGLLTRELAECPAQARMDRFIELAAKMPPGDVMDAANVVFGYHNSLSSGGHLKIDGLFSGVFQAWDLEHYERVAKELGETELAGEKLVTRAGEIYRRAGTPAVCLLLSRKLAAAGERKPSRRYEQNVTHLYENVTSGYSGYKYAHLQRHAYRDLMSVRGFRAQAAEHRERAMIRAKDTDYALSAVDDFYAGKADGMIENLTSSLDPAAKKGAGTFVFGGKVCRDVAALRRALICRAVLSLKLSNEQMTRLAGLRGIDMAEVLAALREVEERARHGPVQFAVDMVDGKTIIGVPELKAVMVRTSYADIRLPLEKIQSVAFRDDRRIADVRLRNGDVVNGVVELGAVKLKTPSGISTVSGKRIKLIALHKSRADRFRAFVTRAGTKEQ